MLRFTGTELHAVLTEAAVIGCRVILVKDHGVYLMSEFGESKPDGDDFDAWWNRARSEFGGDDFAEYFDLDDPVLESLRGTSGSLVVEATSTHLYIAAEIALSGKS
ncbi:hypothetical protein CVV67_25315 [Arthrobacter stackebrandtii]|nr:hypothetical protein CVV67_25315 [Arthrobacter stackebrandtii]